jgi:tetratricopeptide (TPR) repeat protein
MRRFRTVSILAGALLATVIPSAAGSRDQPEFVGSASCRSCHERFYDLWAPSHHGLAMQPYSAAFAAQSLIPQEQPIAVGPQSYRVETGVKQGWFVESGPAGERKLPMVYALGGKNVFYLLTPAERGRLQTLPLAFDVRKREWFDTTASGVRHIPGMVDDEPLHWSAPEFTFNTSCHGCHVSQLAPNYDLKTDTYRTVWTEPGINCETCHGPAGEHVRVFTEVKDGEEPAALEIILTSAFDVEQTNTMCAPCHARMVPLTTSFRPGEQFFDHFDLTALEHRDFYPDGRDLGENYTYTGWRMSPCVQSEQLDCVHCHTSSGRFRFKDDPDRSCLPCHRKRVAEPAAHTRHPAGSAGSRCVACHMPKTEFARMIRSDHSMRPPAPAATLAFESPNACNICHLDRDAAWADRLVREWRSRDYQAPVLNRARLVAAAREGDWSRLRETLAEINGKERDEVHAVSFLRLLRSCDREEKWPAVIQALEDPSPLVRGAAAETLDGYLTPESIPPLLARTADPIRLVRLRAAAALASMPRDWLDQEQRKSLLAATGEFEQAMRARPDDHLSHYNLGNFYAERGELDLAVASYGTATALRPDAIAPYVNASIAHNMMGRNELAEQSLKAALEIDPQNVAAQLNLGMLLGELDRIDEAEQAFRSAISADPESAVAAFNLCVIVAGRDLDEAIRWCRRAREFRPDDPKYAQTLAYYLFQSGDEEGARNVLQPAVEPR